MIGSYLTVADWPIIPIGDRKADLSGRRNGLFFRLQKQCVKRLSWRLLANRFPRP